MVLSMMSLTSSTDLASASARHAASYFTKRNSLTTHQLLRHDLPPHRPLANCPALTCIVEPMRAVGDWVSSPQPSLLSLVSVSPCAPVTGRDASSGRQMPRAADSAIRSDRGGIRGAVCHSLLFVGGR